MDIFAPELSSPSRTYWAADPDPYKFVSGLQKKRDRFWSALENCGLWSRIRRNWRYYHSLFMTEDSGGDWEIQKLGEQGETVYLSIGHLRNLLQHMVSIVTSPGCSFDALAVNTDVVSLDQARLANLVAEYYLQAQNIQESIYKVAAEDALVFTVGYVGVDWDEGAGKGSAAKPEDPWSGDAVWFTPEFPDVFHDVRVKKWPEDVDWVAVRRWANRWDMAGKYPEHADHIMEFDGRDPEGEKGPRFEIDRLMSGEDSDEDRIPYLTFWHRACNWMPTGRVAKVVGDQVVWADDYDFERVPIDRCQAGRFLGTPFGYSPGFDLQGIQEAINAEISTILSNHRAYGRMNMWTPTGSSFEEDPHDGFTHIQSDQRPEIIEPPSMAPEHLQTGNWLVSQAEYVSGINSVARGQPEYMYKSGKALGIVAAKSVQFLNSFGQSFDAMRSLNMSMALLLLQKRATEDRIASIAGSQHRYAIKRSWNGEQIQLVSKYVVKTGNPMMKTLEGRIEVANMLIDRGVIRLVEEYINLLETGNLETILEAERAQLTLIREENEALKLGLDHVPSAIDYHQLHIREHQALLNSVNVRQMEPGLLESVEAAIMHHMALLSEPMVQQLQILQGFSMALPPMMLPGAPPTGPGGPSQPRERQPEGAPVGGKNPQNSENASGGGPPEVQ